MNDTTSEYLKDDTKLVDLPLFWTVLVVIIMVFVLILTIVGNVAVLIVLTNSTVLNSIVNSEFLISLSIADLLVAVLVMPCAMDAVNAGTWRCGPIWSQFNGFGNFLFCISSIMHLMMLSVDRYLAIVRPLFYPVEMTKSRALLLCVVMWLYSALWAFLPLFGVSSYECFIAYIGKCQAEDWSKYGLNFVFAISVVSGTYGLALVSMVYIYWKIAHVVRDQIQRIDKRVSSTNVNPHPKRGKICLFKNARNPSRKKGVVTLLVVTLTYLVCWSPFCILLFIEIGTGEKVEGPASTVAMLIGFANSCCNPIIYTIKYRRFRMVIMRMLGKTNSVWSETVSIPAGTENFSHALHEVSLVSTQ